MSEATFYGFLPDDPIADEYDAMNPIPEAGEHELLDSFCERKHLTPGDLVRVGGRMAQTHVLAFFYPGVGIKYRDLVTDRKWSSPGAEFTSAARIIPGQNGAGAVTVVEGESDAARMSAHVDTDVMIVWEFAAPALPAAWANAIKGYELVYAATDDDAAGNRLAQKIEQVGVKTVRWRPPAKDWCSVEGDLPPLPKPPEKPLDIAWGAGLFDVVLPEQKSLLGEYTLPYQGCMLIHGWKGSYKSWLSFDLAVQLATGGSWAGFETTEAEQRVLIVQFEVKAHGYDQRMRAVLGHLAPHQVKLFHNVGHYAPGRFARFDVKSQQHRDYFRELLESNQVKVAVFDPIRKMVNTSIYEQESQTAIVNFYQQLQDDGVTIITSHHDSKSAARSGGGSNLSMTAGDVLAGHADTIASIALPPGEDWQISRRRNIFWTTRDGAPLPARGVQIVGEALEAQLLYEEEPFGLDDEDVEERPDV